MFTIQLNVILKRNLMLRNTTFRNCFHSPHIMMHLYILSVFTNAISRFQVEYSRTILTFAFIVLVVYIQSETLM